MDKNLEMQMRRNVKLFGPYQVFTKRVFLPLVAIYASQAAGMSVAQIGYAAAAASIATILFETTTGFWADSHGRRAASRVGSFLTMVGSLMFVFFPNFIGIVAASVVVAIGYAFLSGSMAALIHDTLTTLGKVDDFPRIASRAQSLSLLINAGIMALTPLLYPIDKRLPFLVGALAFAILFLLANLLTEPPVRHNAAEEEKQFLRAVHHLINRRTLLFFICAGFMYGLAISASDLFQLRFVQIHIKPEQLGFIFAAGSLVGAVVGSAVHYLRRLTFKQYASFDVMTTVALFAAFAFTSNQLIVILAWIQNMAFWRFQRIMYQHYILKIYGGTRYKATLMSMISNVSSLHGVWVVLLLTGISNRLSIPISMRYGLSMVLLVWPLLLISIGLLEKYAKAPSSPSTH